MNKPVLIIPAYEPRELLVHLIQDLCGYFHRIILVNDGSSLDTFAVFEEVSRNPRVVLLEHAQNLGKGQALKTAFDHYLRHYAKESIGVVTVDADGQHDPKDVIALAEKFASEPNALWLGVRQFDGRVPWRSRVGNRITAWLFQLAFQQKISDTQTGLRAIPNAFIPQLIALSSSRYDFEMDMLIAAIQSSRAIKTMPIHTIYLEQNSHSHFNPFWDSLKIYFVFLRFLGCSLLSTAIDFVVFWAVFFLNHHIFLSLMSGRVISSTANFIFGKKIAFKSTGNITLEAAKYVALVIISMMMAYYLLLFFSSYLGLNIYAGKILAEAILFMMNFIIQRSFVFPSNVSAS